MKRRRSGVALLVLGVILALATGGAVFLTTQEASGQNHIEMTQVLIASQDIPERSVIQGGSLAIRSMPVDLVPPGALTKAEQAVGRMTISKIYLNEIILASKLADTKGQSGISYTLQKGEVVITFPTSDIVTTGAIRPGDTVDVLVTLKPQESKTEAMFDSLTAATTQVTLQNLRVLAIGSVGASAGGGQQQGKEAANLLTFAVSHQDALVLKALKDSPNAVLELALRAAGDQEKVTTDAITIRDIIERYHVRD